MFNSNRRKKGVILIVVLIFMTTLIVIVEAYLYVVSVQLKSSGYDISNAKALWIAEAGVQMAIYNFKTNGTYRSSPTSLGGNLFGGSYSVSQPTLNAQGNYVVTSTGTFSGINRQVTFIATKNSVFNYAAFGGSSVDISGNARTDSYDSSLGRYNVNGNIGSNGDVGGNNNITVSGGSPYVNGNASTGPSGTFSDPTHRYVSGTVSNSNNVSMPAVTVPSTLTNLASSGAMTLGKNDNDGVLNSGDYKYSTINLSSTRKLTINATTAPVNVYLTGNSTSISIANSAQIAIPATNTYPVTMYTDGSSSVGGAGVVNNTYIPSNLLLYDTGTGAISVSNGGSFYGAIYAPSASVRLTGAGVLYGSIVANSLTLANSGTVHYDKALQNISINSSTDVYSVKSWREVIPAQ